MWLLVLVAGYSHSQYCGNSGPQVCTPQYYVADTGYWFHPPFDSLPCIVRNNPYNETVTIRLDALPTTFSGQSIILSLSLLIDSIVGLPDGICWATNDSDNHVSNAWLCINFTGTTNQPVGDYVFWLHGKSTPLGIPINPDGDGSFKKSFTLRVRNTTDMCLAIASSIPDTHYNPPLLVATPGGISVTASLSVTHITVTDVMGRQLIMEKISPSEKIAIPLADYHGLLLVSVVDENGIKTQKMVWR